MDLKVIWTDYAKTELHRIFQYYKIKTNTNIGKTIVEKIVEEALILGKFPFMGQVEELLKDRKEGFRYYLYSNYKIIYYIDLERNLVEIVDIFDTRQQPLNIKRTK